MESRTRDLDHHDWRKLVGKWAIDASHRMLSVDEMRGEMTFEWLDGHRLLICRSRYDNSETPDAIAVFGVIDQDLRHVRAVRVRNAPSPAATSALALV